MISRKISLNTPSRKSNNLIISQIGLLLAACGGGQTSTTNNNSTAVNTNTVNTSNTQLANLFNDTYSIPLNHGSLEYYNDGSLTVMRSDQSAAVPYLYSDSANPPISDVPLSGNQFIDGLLMPNSNGNAGKKWAGSGEKTIISFSFMDIFCCFDIIHPN